MLHPLAGERISASFPLERLGLPVPKRQKKNPTSRSISIGGGVNFSFNPAEPLLKPGVPLGRMSIVDSILDRACVPYNTVESCARV